MRLESVLDVVLAENQRLGGVAARAMRPGIPQAAVRERFAELGLPCPEEVSVLFAWRDGTSIGVLEGDVCFFPGYVLLRLDHACGTYSANAALFNRGELKGYWEKAWFPVFSDCGGSYYAIDCCEDPGRRGRIFKITPGRFSEPHFGSLVKMFLGMIECYRSGAYFVTDEGFLEEDFDRSALIHGRFNLELAVWSRYRE